ncbi:hypothetical protein C7120_01270 [Prevotella sp. oral taxon 376]|nr:hypothetical protein C7120_01270 [Prevotella sp. oral taxon 376]
MAIFPTDSSVFPEKFTAAGIVLSMAAGMASDCRSMSRTRRMANIGMLVFSFAISVILLLELGFSQPFLYNTTNDKKARRSPML